jgi:hypothetical protein
MANQIPKVYLALKYLCYLLALEKPDEELQRPAWNALQQAIQLARAKQISWVTDLSTVLSSPRTILTQLITCSRPTGDSYQAHLISRPGS